jgi:hypothetical protein
MPDRQKLQIISKVLQSVNYPSIPRKKRWETKIGIPSKKSEANLWLMGKKVQIKRRQSSLNENLIREWSMWMEGTAICGDLYWRTCSIKVDLGLCTHDSAWVAQKAATYFVHSLLILSYRRASALSLTQCLLLIHDMYLNTTVGSISRNIYSGVLSSGTQLLQGVEFSWSSSFFCSLI